MKINKSKLTEALEIVKPGLANKELIEQATSFAFIEGQVVTYNDEISISHPVEGLELEGAILADKLYSILTKLKTDEIEATINEKEIVLQSGKSKIVLTLQSEIKLPLDEDVSEVGKFKTLPTNFLKYMKFAVGSCSKDQSQPLLTCVSVSKDSIVGSDGYRVTQCTMEDSIPVEPFLIPIHSALNVIKLNPTKIAEGAGWVHFMTEQNTIISCRILEENYPDISQHVKVKGSKIVLPLSLIEIIDRASVFAKRDFAFDELINITIADKKLKVSAECDSGSFEETTNIRYSDQPISFTIMPYLLRGILSEQSECTISDSKLKFEGEGWIYVTVLSEEIKTKTHKAVKNPNYKPLRKGEKRCVLS